jgi:hypothetical protein
VPRLRLLAGRNLFSEGSQNRWLLVVWMTAVPWAVLTVRSYRSVSWLTSTAATVSALVLPALTLVARTLSPGLRAEIALVVPSASRTVSRR